MRTARRALLCLRLLVVVSTTAVVHQQSEPAACGFVIGAFGNPDGRSVVAAIYTIRKLLDMKPQPGWCPGSPDLGRYPVTLFTDVQSDVLVGRGMPQPETAGLDYRVLGVNEFDPTPPSLTGSTIGHLHHLGAPAYRWYHCQVRVVSVVRVWVCVGVCVCVCCVGVCVRARACIRMHACE